MDELAADPFVMGGDLSGYSAPAEIPEVVIVPYAGRQCRGAGTVSARQAHLFGGAPESPGRYLRQLDPGTRDGSLSTT